MGKTLTKKYTRHTRSQQGGIKVLLPNLYNPVMEREILTTNDLQTILSNTTNIETVSTGSLNSFVVRLHLDRSTILFRSDTLDTKKSLMSRQSKSLSSAQVENETDGMPIYEIIMKICLIEAPGNKINLDKFKGRDKDSLDRSEIRNEYQTQRYLYSSMMSISGNPFCPDAFGFIMVNPPPVTHPPTLVNIFRTVPNIQTILQSDADLTLVNNYINKYAGLGFQIGFILMESIPSSYNTIYHYSLKTETHYNEDIYKKLCEGIAAINILSIYRGKLFNLDAHPGNWLCNPSASSVQKIKQIDFGRVYRIDGDTNLRHLILDTQQNIEIYIRNILQLDEYAKKELTNRFYVLLGVKDSQLDQYSSEQNLNLKIDRVKSLFTAEIYSLIDQFRTNEYFSKPYISMGVDERKMNIKMIHRIILISALIDSLYNCAKYKIKEGQISHIYNVILNIAVLNPFNILNYPITIDLDEYNLIRPDKAVILKKTYQRVYDIIYKYSGENNFPRIRNYERFKEIYRNRAEKAWIKLRHIGGGIAIFSKAAASGIAKCSRVIGGVLSYIPCASLASRAASSLFESTVDLKHAVKIKTTNAFRKLKSKLSSAHPYQPILPPPQQRASSPRAAAKIISPLSYGGSACTRTRTRTRTRTHNNKIHRRTKKY
jgi:hypothetical protein